MHLPSGHSFHIVDVSPWPLVGSLAAFLLTGGMVSWFSGQGMSILLIGLVMTVLVMVQWWRDIVREGSFQGAHTSDVETGLRYGMILFIVSEVMFFFSFFWAFFHSSLSPTMEVGGQWPPLGIEALNPFEVPLLNTMVLLASGVTVTWAHRALIDGNHSQSVQSLMLTCMLGGYFSFLQALEYIEASFTIADSVYGATFFVATGFHGLHVLIGATFLAVCLSRLGNYHFSSGHHFGFEAAAWYWHFVDVVWLFLFLTIYWWGGS